MITTSRRRIYVGAIIVLVAFLGLFAKLSMGTESSSVVDEAIASEDSNEVILLTSLASEEAIASVSVQESQDKVIVDMRTRQPFRWTSRISNEDPALFPHSIHLASALGTRILTNKNGHEISVDRFPPGCPLPDFKIKEGQLPVLWAETSKRDESTIELAVRITHGLAAGIPSIKECTDRILISISETKSSIGVDIQKVKIRLTEPLKSRMIRSFQNTPIIIND